MKTLFFGRTLLVVMMTIGTFMLSADAFGQVCSACQSASCTIGAQATGACAFSAGESAQADAANSICIGYKSVTDGGSSLTFGNLLSTSSGTNNNMVIGFGSYPSTLLTNSISKSIMMGVNSDLPTVFIESSSGSGTWGNVGIGTTDPNTTFQVVAMDEPGSTEAMARFGISGNTADFLQLKNTENTNGEFAASFTAKSNSDQKPALQFIADNSVDGAGQVGIPVIEFDCRVSGGAPSNRPLVYFRDPSSVKMMIGNNGNVGVGTTSPMDLLHVNGGACKPSTNTWTICSDANLKTDISEFTDGLEVLREINPIWFRYNGIGGLPTEPLTPGVIAQQVLEVAPYMIDSAEMVIDTATNETMSVLTYNANALFYLLLNSVKELDQRTEQLTQMSGQVESLSNSYSDLENQFNELNQVVNNCCNSQSPSFKQSNTNSIDNATKPIGSIAVHPNPFQNETTLSYSIGATFTKGMLLVSDSSGEAIYQIPISENSGSISITSNDLAVGTYFCSLLIDGASVGSTSIVKIQ